MKWYVIVSLIFFPIAMVNCTGSNRLPTDSDSQRKNNYVDRNTVGIGIEFISGDLVIKSVEPDSPASKGGLEVGDIISLIDGRRCSLSEYDNLLQSKKTSDQLKLTVKHNSKINDINLAPINKKTPRTTIKIDQLLSSNSRVAIAVIVEQISNTYKTDSPDQAKAWGNAVKYGLQRQIERGLLSSFEYHSHFALVDRSVTNKILDEFALGMSGLISDDLRVRIGRMTGATYILSGNMSRTRDKTECIDEIDVRLIEIESGKVLAIDNHMISGCS